MSRRLPLIACTCGVIGVALAAMTIAGWTLHVVALTLVVSGLVAMMSIAAIQRSADRGRVLARLDERLRFELGDVLRTAARSDDALAQAAARLGRYLGVSRCVFLEIDPSGGHATVRGEYCDGVPAIDRTHAMGAWSFDGVAASRAGKIVVNGDASLDERTADRYETALRPVQIRSYVAVPLVRNDRWAGTVLVSSEHPRRWQPHEVVLVQSVGEQTWLWFEHLVTVEAHRQREEYLAAVLDAAFDAMISIDGDGTIVDFNRAAEHAFGRSRDDVVGRPIVDVLVPPAHREAHRAAFARLLETAHPSALGKPTRLPAACASGSELAIEVSIARMHELDPPRFTVLIRDVTERKRAMDQVLLAIEAAPTGMILVDRDGNIALVNAQLETLFGYPRELLVSQPVELLVPEPFRNDHPGLRKAFLGDPRFHTMGAGRELFGLHRDGRQIPISIALNPFHNENGEFVLASVVDITERKRAEQAREDLLGQLGSLNAELERRVRDRTAQLTAALKERDVLLQEVHHRVKNNLQIISSLIKLQSRKVENVDNRSGLDECRRRVEAIALIHEQLYQADDYAQVPFADYVRRLVGNVFHAGSAAHSAVTLGVDVENILLPVDKAIPCGLILNELITNALKHAFPGGRHGSIRIELQHADEDVLLAVRDDGVGAPQNVTSTGGISLGMKLVEMLVKQIHGQLDISRDGGMTFQIRFPLRDASAVS